MLDLLCSFQSPFASPNAVRQIAHGGDNEVRTRDLLRARQALSQLSYIPILGQGQALKIEQCNPDVRVVSHSVARRTIELCRPPITRRPIDLGSTTYLVVHHGLPRKEVIQQHLQIRQPCYD